MEFQKDDMFAKYKWLYNEYIKHYEPDFSDEGLTVRFARIPDTSLSSDLCSRRILMHFDAKKALFPRAYSKLPKGAEPLTYCKLYYDKNGKLHHLEHRINDNVCYITTPVSDKLVTDHRVDYTSGKAPSVTPVSMEWTEYDQNGLPVSVESYCGNGSLAAGVKISCEYYQYENGNMIHADQFREYAPGGKAGDSLVRLMVPDRITDPDVFAYDLECTEGGILCKRTNYWSRSKTYTASWLMPEKELKKMEEHGIRCFGQ